MVKKNLVAQGSFLVLFYPWFGKGCNDMGKEIQEYNVSMSNTLARASHSLTINEKRALMCAVALIDSRKGNLRDAHLSEFSKVRITAVDYAETYGVSSKNAYRDLVGVANNIFERQFSTRAIVNGKERITRHRWVSSATYAESEGFVELSFTPEIYEHLNVLRKQYTTYKLKVAAALKSTYSWRLFEVSQSWMKHCEQGKSVTITLENFKHLMTAPESYIWNNIRQKILIPAIKEIEEKMGA